MKQDRPLLIVTSCTRNYGWVTRAFLEGNTRWADYIVIVDQMSTDATRPLIKEYNDLRNEGVNELGNEGIHRAEIVIVDDPDMTYKENTRAKMGFMKGRELAAGRDAIYFALDIDEVMAANWMDTEDGKKILTSKPGDMFQLEWANIMPDGKNCNRSGWQYKVFHDNGMAWQDTEEQMHTALLPYSSWDETKMNSVQDFPLLHFGDFNKLWTYYKRVYYQFLDIQQHRSKSSVSLFRMYNSIPELRSELRPIEKEWLFADADLIGMVDVKSEPIFVQYIREILSNDGSEKYQAIDIWTKEICSILGVQDPRTAGWKVLHSYLRGTQPRHKSFMVRAIDKVLKQFC